MATKLDAQRAIQRAMWSVHFHRYFHTDARPVPPDIWDKLKPISLTEAVDFLWNDTEAKRKVAQEATHDAEGVTPPSLMALMRLYSAYQLRRRYPEIFRSKFHGGHLPDDLTGVFPVNLDKVRELYAATAVGRDSPEGIQQPMTADLPVQLNQEEVRALELYAISAVPSGSMATAGTAYPLTMGLPASLTMPDYTDPSDLPQDPLDQLPCPEPGFRLLAQPDWEKVFDVRNYVLDITHHTATDWLSVIWSIDVQRPLSGMLKSLDPRNWDYCSSNVQIATEALRSDPCPLYDPGRPANEGASWQNYFWEKLGINGGNGNGSVVLCNQLYFTFNVSAQAVVTTFSDVDPGENTTQLDSLIEFDRGWGAYGPVPGDTTWTRLRVVKYVKFKSEWATQLAVVLLHNWAFDEALAEVGCDPH
jgi:hypothetical protein